MQGKEVWGLFKSAMHDWSKDKVPRLSASLSYYTIMSLAPLLVITVAVLGLFMIDAREQVLAQMQALMGTAGRTAAVEIMDHAIAHGTGKFAAVVSLVLLAFGAAGVFVEIQDSMNTIWQVKPKPHRNLWGVVKRRFLSMAMVFGIAFLLLVSLIISTILSAIGHRIVGGIQLFAQFFDIAVSIAGLSLLFSALFKWVPDVNLTWRDVLPGGILTAVLFTLGKMGLGLYLVRGSTASAYGAAGSLAALLIWVYYTAQIVFFGAEFTKAYAKHCEGTIQPDSMAVRVE